MSDNINQWHISAGEALSSCGSSTSATARLRGNNRYLDAASNISPACSVNDKYYTQKKKTESSFSRNRNNITSYLISLSEMLEATNKYISYLIRFYILQSVSVPEPTKELKKV